MASGAAVLKGEIHNLLSVLRLNTRWASEERFRREIPLRAETALLFRLKELQELLNDHPVGPRELEAPVYLRPFADVAVSPEAGNLATGMALGAMQKFLLYGIIDMDSLCAFDGANLIADAVCRCRFEETDRDLDEVVLMNLLDLTQSCLRSDVGVLLTDDAVWGLFEAAFRISGQARGSALLRTTAFNTLANMVLIVFGRTEDFLAMHPASQLRPPPPPPPPLSASASPSPAAPKLSGSARQRIVKYLGNLADNRVHDLRTCMLALSLTNVALETGGAHLTEDAAVVEVLRSDLCRVLLQASQAEDLNVLTLVLRVIFNLFNGIKEHMKVQLEVFLLSVHVALVESASASHAQKELALESLLEFCREPLLMLDLYVNYDCDVHCTNLFETICRALAKTAHNTGARQVPGGDLDALATASKASARCYAAANPRQMLEGTGGAVGAAPALLGSPPRVPPIRTSNMNVLNKLALEGILAVIDAIAKRCRAVPSPPRGASRLDVASMSPIASRDELLSDPDSMGLMSPPRVGALVRNVSFNAFESIGDLDSTTEVDDLDSDGFDGAASQQWLINARERTASVLQERKRLKKRLELVKRCFNGRWRSPSLSDSENDGGGASPVHALAAAPASAKKLAGRKDWINLACELGVFTKDANATGGADSGGAPDGMPSGETVARFLKETAGLDKRKIGEYLGKGPADKYPFHAEVRRDYARLHDFAGMRFHDALRTYLEGFHLPGEAQCIDRLMECFATELYQQWSALPTQVDPAASLEKEAAEDGEGGAGAGSGSSSSGGVDEVDEDVSELSDDVPLSNPFLSADAAFVLSFSSIMLNTDLHNPNLPEEKRMTLEQFKRNNRGINDGIDFPEDFLEDLYESIRTQEVKTRTDVVGLTDTGIRDTNLFIRAMEQRFSHAKSRRRRGTPQPLFARTGSPMPLDRHVGSIMTVSAAAASHGAAGVHEREMFAVICVRVREAIFALFEQSIDDLLVVKCLHGLLSYMRICAYFQMHGDCRVVLERLLRYALKYSTRLMYDPFVCAVRPPNAVTASISVESGEGGEWKIVAAAEGLLPVPNPNYKEWSGAASHRGMLAAILALHLLNAPLRSGAAPDRSDPSTLALHAQLHGMIAKWMLHLWWHGLMPKKLQALSEPRVSLSPQRAAAADAGKDSTEPVPLDLRPNPTFDPLEIQQRDPVMDRRKRRQSALAALQSPEGAGAGFGFGFGLGLGLGNVFGSFFQEDEDEHAEHGEAPDAMLADGPSVLGLSLEATGLERLLGYGRRAGDLTMVDDALMLKALLGAALERCQATLTQYPDGDMNGDGDENGGEASAREKLQKRIRLPAEVALLMEWACTLCGLAQHKAGAPAGGRMSAPMWQEWMAFFAAFFDGNSRSKYTYVSDGGLFCIERVVVTLLLVLQAYRIKDAAAVKPQDMLRKLSSLPSPVVRRLGPRLALGFIEALKPLVPALSDLRLLEEFLAFLSTVLAQVPLAENGAVLFLEEVVSGAGACTVGTIAQMLPLIAHLTSVSRYPATKSRVIALLPGLSGALLEGGASGGDPSELWDGFVDLCADNLLDEEEEISRSAFEALQRLFLDAQPDSGSAGAAPCDEDSNPEHTGRGGAPAAAAAAATAPKVTAEHWADVFMKALTRLPITPFDVAPSGESAGPVRVSVEAQLRSISFVSRVFTLNVKALAGCGRLAMTWLSVVEFYGTILATTTPSSMTQESAAQLLANMIIFLTHENHLRCNSGSSSSGRTLGEQTWDLLDRLAPDMRKEVQLMQVDIELPPPNPNPEFGSYPSIRSPEGGGAGGRRRSRPPGAGTGASAFEPLATTPAKARPEENAAVVDDGNDPKVAAPTQTEPPAAAQGAPEAQQAGAVVTEKPAAASDAAPATPRRVDIQRSMEHKPPATPKMDDLSPEGLRRHLSAGRSLIV